MKTRIALWLQEKIGIALVGIGLWWFMPWLCLVAIGMLLALSAAFASMRMDRINASP